MRFQCRQGDIYLDQIEAIPEGAKPDKPAERIVLAYGEVTGHAHAFYSNRVTMYRDDAGGAFVDVLEPTGLKHEEHGTITVPKGKFRVIRQREYHPEELRNIAD